MFQHSRTAISPLALVFLTLHLWWMQGAHVAWPVIGLLHEGLDGARVEDILAEDDGGTAAALPKVTPGGFFCDSPL